MGTIQIDGSTPKLTIGNATAEDATILFDGNAQDFYIALDDSADDLLIGLGSTGGTTPIISIDENKLSTFSGAITVGVDDTGHDVKLFGATAGSYWLWDESADGVVQIGTITVGVNDAGHDVKFFGDAASAYMLWDTSADDLILAGGAGLIVPDGQFTLGSTAVAATAAELNLLDGGTSVGSSITIADADGFVVNDGGTMKTIPATDIPTYVGGGISQADSWGISSATAIEDGFLTSNWYNATEGGVPLGSALTESSGVFSFPSTGFYLINYQFTCQSSSSNYAFTSVYCSMHWTEDNSSYGLLATTFPVVPAIASSNVYNSASHSIIIDVVNTTNVKFKFKIRAYAGAGTEALTIHGLTTGLHSGFTCVRLADT